MSDDIGPRKIEQILRAAGISKSMARAIVARGYRAAAAQPDGADENAAAELARAIRAFVEIMKEPLDV